MPELDWGAFGTRFYEAGVDRGVLYIDGQPGVAWAGLTAVNEDSSGGDSKPFYIDGIKYLNLPSAEEFGATITAFTYPDEFAQCDGTAQPRSGLFLMQQPRSSFGMSYRTKVGNDQSVDFGYKIHLVYNALAAPSQRSNKSISDSIDPTDFSWTITTLPADISEYKPTSHVIIDSRTTDPTVLALIEATLYGDDDNDASLPDIADLIALYDTDNELIVIDNGDGTFTVTGPADTVRMIDGTTFEITGPTAVFIDDDSYTISS